MLHSFLSRVVIKHPKGIGGFSRSLSQFSFQNANQAVATPYQVLNQNGIVGLVSSTHA